MYWTDINTFAENSFYYIDIGRCYCYSVNARVEENNKKKKSHSLVEMCANVDDLQLFRHHSSATN